MITISGIRSSIYGWPARQVQPLSVCCRIGLSHRLQGLPANRRPDSSSPLLKVSGLKTKALIPAAALSLLALAYCTGRRTFRADVAREEERIVALVQQGDLGKADALSERLKAGSARSSSRASRLSRATVG